MTAEPDERVEEIAFEPGAEVDEADLVELEVDGARVPCVLVAIVEDGDVEYAVLQPRVGEDPDLLLARYDEGAVGVARFRPVDDPAVVERVQTLLLRILPADDVDGVDSGSDEA